MRRIFTATQHFAEGGTTDSLAWGLSKGKWSRLDTHVYIEGTQPPTWFELALARMLAWSDPIWGTVAGQLHDFDAMTEFRHVVPSRRQTELLDPSPTTVDKYSCTSALQTIVDVAYLVDDLVWEQCLESGLRKDAFAINDIEALLPRIKGSRRHGSPRIRRVLDLRPAGAPPTESYLETLMVQLARRIGAPLPTRQYRVFNRDGEFEARVDLCWPELGVFIELDGEQHKGQPVYDANRETRVVAATGWLCGRFSYSEVKHNPQPTGRRLLGVLDQARRRPVAPLVSAPTG